MRALATALALSALFIGCGGSGSGSATAPATSTTLPGPAHLTAAQGAAPSEIALAWTAPASPVDGYILAFKVDSGAYTMLNGQNNLIPAAYTSMTLTFTGAVPEATTFTFRIKGVRGSTDTSYSNEAAYKTGLNTPYVSGGSYDFANHGVHLNWNSNSLVASDVTLQRADCASDGTMTTEWVDLATVTTGLGEYLDTSAAQNRYYLYRVANLLGATSSPYSSPSAPIFTGIPTPTILAAYYDSSQNGVVLNWTNDTYQANGAKLERAPSDGTGVATGPWTTLPLPAGISTSYLDQSIPELAQCVYRVTLFYDALSSPPSMPSNLVVAGLLPPSALAAVPAPGGIQLSWQNHSLAGAQITVYRGGNPYDLSAVATLSPTTSSYLDANPPLGYYIYKVVVMNGAFEASSQVASASTPNPPGALALSTSQLSLPASNWAALRPNGSWGFANQSPFGMISNGDPWTPNFPSDLPARAHDLLQMDAQGYPHLVFLAHDASGSSDLSLTHMWWDGAAWRREELARTNFAWTTANDGFSFCLDSTGLPHVLLDHSDATHPYGGSTSTLTYVHKSGGLWVSDALSGLDPFLENMGSYHLRVDQSGTPHLLMGDWTSLIEYVPDGAGGWISATLPTGQISAGWYDFLDGAWVDKDNAFVCYETAAPANLGYLLMVIRKTGGVWQAPVTVGTRAVDGYETRAKAASTPDLSRICLLYDTSVGLKAYMGSGSGWTETLVAPNSGDQMDCGLDSARKAHILIYHGGTDYTELHE